MTIYGNHCNKMVMYKVSPPDLDDCKSFDEYRAKLKVWVATTSAEEAKLGALVAASLPNDSKRYKKDLQVLRLWKTGLRRT